MDVNKLETDESTESDSKHGTANEIMNEVKEKNWNILGDDSF